MIIPTEEQVIERWDELPESLKEALTSDANSDLIWKISEAEHVPDQKIYEIGRAVSHVLYGFIHPEDVPVELRDGSQLNPQIVASITNQLNQKIFAPLQQDINKVYHPLTRMGTGPKIMQEVRPPQMSVTATQTAISPKPTAAAPGTAPKPLGQVISQTASGFNVSASPLASNKNVAAPAPQAPRSGGTDWSKQVQQNPVVKLGVITPNMPTQTPSAAPANSAATSPRPAAPQQSMQQQSATPAPTKSMSEFERLDMMKKSSEPAPVMLHEVAGSASLQSSPNFKFNQTAQNQINAATPQKPQSVKPAVIEFSGGQQPAEPSKVVHYSEYKTSIPAPGNTGPRDITQITQAPKQVTAPPPMPQKAPMPTQMDSAQPQQEKPQGKVIVQDFLGPQK